MTTLQKVKETITRHALLEKGRSVLVGFSGGPDSVALLHILCSLRRSHKLTVGAVYINHQMRPRAARKEEQFCQLLCDELSVPLTIVRENVPALATKEKQGLEETARNVRYAIFDRLARTHPYDRVALGHHADDQVETILFRLFRGTGPSGLTGMPIKRGKYIRPLLGLTRAEILSYLKKYSLNWCEDASNRSLKFRRNWIRRRLLPFLRDNLNPQVGAAVLSMADSLAEDEAYLESIIDRVVRKTVRTTPGGKITLALESWRTYSLGLRRRLLRYCLKATCPTMPLPGRDAVARLDGLALSREGSLSLPGRIQAEVVGSTMYLWASRRTKVKRSFGAGERFDLDWPAVSFRSRLDKGKPAGAGKRKNSSQVRLDWNKISPPLEIRTVEPGDRFRPLGMKGHKKVGDFLTDRKVPRPVRDEVLLLCDGAGPVWVVGHEIADRVKIDERTRKVLTVAISVKQEHGRPAV